VAKPKNLRAFVPLWPNHQKHLFLKHEIEHSEKTIKLEKKKNARFPRIEFGASYLTIEK